MARVEGRHGAGAVDADQPVGLGAAACRIGQALHLLFAAQLLKTFADGLGRHGLQPQTRNRLAQRALGTTGVLLDQAEDQLTFAARVTGVDQLGHVLALGLLDHGVQAALGLVDRLEVKARGNHRQIRKAPLATLDVKFFRRLNFHQVAYGAGDHKLRVFKMVFVLVELAIDGREGAHNVLRH